MSELLTVAEVAEAERCSAETVRRAIRRGELAARRLNPDAVKPRYRVTPEALAEWRALRAAPKPQVPEAPRPVDMTEGRAGDLRGLGYTGTVHVERKRRSRT